MTAHLQMTQTIAGNEMKSKVRKRAQSRGRLISLILSAAMILTMMPAMAFAATGSAQQDVSSGTASNLVVFGNSTSSGFGMPGFRNEKEGYSKYNNNLEKGYEISDGSENSGKVFTLEMAEALDHGRMDEAAFPWQLKKYLDDGTGSCTLIPLCFNGMRTDELRAFLDKDYYNSVKEREYNYSKEADKGKGYGFLTYHIDHYYIRDLYDCGAISENTYEAAQAYICDSIRNANVIVLDVCGNNFGTYMGYRLAITFGMDGMKMYEPNTKESIKDVKDLPGDLEDKIEALEGQLLKQYPDFADGAARQILDMYLYSLADCIVNFSADMQIIRALNKDAEVIAVGLENPMEGLSFDLGGQTVDFGKVAGALFGIVNTYMKSLDTNSNNYYYADISDGIETFSSCIMNANSYEELMADESYTGGNYALNTMYRAFMEEFGFYETVYEQLMAGVNAGVAAYLQNPEIKIAYNKWGNLKNDSSYVTFTLGGTTYYVTLDIAKLANINEAISFSPSPEDVGTVHPLKKGLVKGLADSMFEEQGIKEPIQKMIYNSLQPEHGVINIGGLIQMFSAGGLDAAQAGISDYLTGKTNDLDPAIWGLLNLYERYVLDHSIGSHPNVNGCNQKYEAVKKAYDSKVTGYEQTKAEIEAGLAAVVEMLRSTGAGDDIDAIIAKLTQIRKAMELLDAAEPYIEEAAEYKKQFNAVMNQTLDLLGITTDDLMKQAQAVLKSLEGADIEKLAENLKFLDDCVRKMPETTNQVIAEISNLREKAEIIRQMLEEAGVLKSNKILDELKALAAKLAAAETKEDYLKIVAELTPIGEELLSIGSAVADLPEYEAAVDEYMYVSKNAISNLEGRMTAVESQIAMLTARAVNSKFTTKVTFSGGKAAITLSLKTDELADGYTLKLNGKEVNYTEKNGKLIYTVNNAKVGKKYKFELTPFVLYDDEDGVAMLDGKTTTKTVTPKVSLKKVTLKSVKGGKKSVTAKWAKVKGADGYRISCKSGGKTKTVFVKGGSKVSKKITKLTSGKKYTVKVRAYKTVNGKKYYGSWSKTKTAKAK